MSQGRRGLDREPGLVKPWGAVIVEGKGRRLLDAAEPQAQPKVPKAPQQGPQADEVVELLHLTPVMVDDEFLERLAVSCPWEGRAASGAQSAELAVQLVKSAEEQSAQLLLVMSALELPLLDMSALELPLLVLPFHELQNLVLVMSALELPLPLLVLPFLAMLEIPQLVLPLLQQLPLPLPLLLLPAPLLLLVLLLLPLLLLLLGEPLPMPKVSLRLSDDKAELRAGLR